MAALTITAIRATQNTVYSNNVLYGATLAVGVPVYKAEATGKHLAADNNASAATRAVVGITFSPGVDDGYGLLAIRGNIVLVGATMTVGAKYYLGATAGEIVPFGDLASTQPVVEIGTAKSATELILGILDTGAVIA